MKRIIDSKLINAIRFSDQSNTLHYLNNIGFTNKIKSLLLNANSQFVRSHFELALDSILEHMRVYDGEIYFALSDIAYATFDNSEEDYNDLIGRVTDLIMLRNMAKALAQSMFEGIE